MRLIFHLEMTAEVFDTLESKKAETVARSLGGQVYTWKTVGRRNWLGRGYRMVDALALVVLPGAFPDTVHVCDDVPEEGVDG